MPKRSFYEERGALYLEKRTERKALFTQVENMMNEYCEGCFVHRQLKREKGRRAAHRFCITQCTVGERLRNFGEKLQ